MLALVWMVDLCRGKWAFFYVPLWGNALRVCIHCIVCGVGDWGSFFVYVATFYG